MFILTDTETLVLFKGTNIEFGLYDEPIEKWKIEDESFAIYSLDGNYNKYEVSSIPVDFKYGKYCYTEELGFYQNFNYVEPINTEVEISKLKQENIDLKTQLDNVQEVLDYLVMQ